MRAEEYSGPDVGYRSQNARDEDERKAWRSMPLRERYIWRSVAIVVALGVLMAIAVATRLVAAGLWFHR